MTLREIYAERGLDGVLDALEPIYADLTKPSEPASTPALPEDDAAVEEEKE